MTKYESTLTPLRRQSTWSGSNTVVVFVRSNDSLYLDDKDDVIAQEEPLLKIEALPRMPWRSGKDIYIPSDKSKHPEGKKGITKTCDCCQYVATVNVDHADRRLRFKRALGTITQLYVFENPLRAVG